jgi:hypothetical protein
VRVRAGRDTLAFDLEPLAVRYADSAPAPGAGMVVEGAGGTRKAALVLTNLSGQRSGDSLATVYWGGTLLLGE